MTQPEDHVYLVGGGIAALAATVFLIRDAGYEGKQIHILEGSDLLGGSLDGSGDAETGYVIRGGRMFEEHFACTYDLLAEIPTLDNPDVCVADEIQSFTQQIVTSSNCRLVVAGERVEAPRFGLSMRDKWDLLCLNITPEAVLRDKSIEEFFSPHFFSTDFWTMWCTMFAFQTWHSVAEMRRYMRRYMHLLPGFNRLEGIHRTRLNQFDSIVRPVVEWLQERQVNFHMHSPVTNVSFGGTPNRIEQIQWQEHDKTVVQDISSTGRVMITLGSMTEGSTLGSMSSAPARCPEVPDSSWSLWRRIAPASIAYGNPERFAGNPTKTLWESFTVTLREPDYFLFMASFTGNEAGTGGLVTFKDSAWLLSIVLSHQPHFADQDENTYVFWGYGLSPYGIGDAVRKPMLECTGEEILRELAHLYGVAKQVETMFRGAICIPCVMPFITAQFMPRLAADRPKVIPEPGSNFAFLGQFCGMPDDTVFTVEYSVRSAQQAVYGLSGLARRPASLYRGFEKPAVVGRALLTLLRNGRESR